MALPIIFVDDEQHIRMAVSQTLEIAVESDRAIYDVARELLARLRKGHRAGARLLPDPTLVDDARRVIETLMPLETVVRDGHAGAYLRRVLPYRTADKRIDGVVLTWVDITQRLAAEAESHALRGRLGT